MAGQSVQQKADVETYYNGTKRDYHYLWRSSKSLGIHFGYYDENHRTHDSAVLHLNQKLAEAAKIRSDDHVLDAGCGIGGSSIWLAATYGCKITGINIVPWQLQRAHTLARKRKLDRLVEFRRLDYADTNLPAGTFTVVWGLESVVHAEDKAAVIREAYRLLEPGGRLVICEYFLTKEKLSEEERALITEWLRGWAMPSLQTVEQYHEQLASAGFTQIKMLDWTDNISPSIQRLARLIRRLGPTAPLLRRVGFLNQAEIANLHASKAQVEALAERLWRYGVLVAHKPTNAHLSQR